MAYTGHVMGASIETDMRKDAFAHLQKLSDSYYSNTKVGADYVKDHQRFV